MYEDRTYESILKEMLQGANKEVDTREGSILFDAIAPVALKFAELYTQLSILYNQMFLKTAINEALDLKGDERLVSRKSATQAEYEFIYTGIAPPLGSSFYTEDGLYFTLLQYDNGNYYLESVETGTGNNNVTSGTNVVPVDTFTDLMSAQIWELYVPAIDVQEDESYRDSIYDSIVPGENGNIQHYKNWCKEIDGVGPIRIIPCGAGPNTVIGVILASDGSAASDELCNKVQDYIDPATKGYTVLIEGETFIMGDGLGEGVANIGAHFIALSPKKVSVDIKIYGIAISEGVSEQEIIKDIKTTVEGLFKEIIVENDRFVIRSSEVGAVIQALDNVEGYENIKFVQDSIETYDINLSVYQAPIIGDVILQ